MGPSGLVFNSRDPPFSLIRCGHNMRRQDIIGFFRRLLGTSQILGRLDWIEMQLSQLAGNRTTGSAPAGLLSATAKLEILPGTPYSKYETPIEYLPSRDFQPRWGYAKPRIHSLCAWFAEYLDDYRNILADMSANKVDLANIPRDFNERNLPSPAWCGVPYSPFDGAALYTLIKKFRPKRYHEIGSGISTCFAYKAIAEHCPGAAITSIDPEPRAAIDTICTRVIRDGLETCNLEIFEELEANDILFFDGSHRAFMNSDVTVFLIDVLPRLKPGVLVHVHDIFLPYDYPDSFKHWYWNEQYLLAVYLMNARHRIRPVFPTNFVCREPSFAPWFRAPLIDLGSANDGWLGGGAMWFTHLQNYPSGQFLQ